MSEIVFLKGPRIHLRALTEKDLTDEYLQWLNDEEVCRQNSHAIFPYTERRMQEYFHGLHNQQKDIVFAIIHTEKARHIGNASLQNINWVSRNGELAMILGNKEFWRGGFGVEAAKLIIEYAFERLNLHRIYSATMRDNKGALNLVKQVNMKQEGVREDAIYKDGKYHDILEFGILRKDYNNNVTS